MLEQVCSIKLNFILPVKTKGFLPLKDSLIKSEIMSPYPISSFREFFAGPGRLPELRRMEH